MSDSSVNRREWGKEGEELAVSFLTDKNFEILEQNYFAGRRGEIDIIAIKDNLVLFVEVKTRNSTDGQYGGAIRAISNKKIASLRKTAEYFLVKHPEYYKKQYTYRFDLITIEDGEIQWVQDILR